MTILQAQFCEQGLCLVKFAFGPESAADNWFLRKTVQQSLLFN